VVSCCFRYFFPKWKEVMQIGCIHQPQLCTCNSDVGIANE
jgi:hypothetical protein